MNSRGSWSFEGIEPSVRERAEAAARRAGMSVEDWLNSAISDPSAPPPQPNAAPAHEGQDVTEIHQRLDEIARQIDHISRTSGAPQPPMARQLNDAISRLDDRVEQAPAFTAAPRSLSAAATTPPTDEQTSPLDRAVAEILARQGELERDRSASGVSAAEWTGFEQRLSKISDHLEALQGPGQLEQAVTGLRSELADIRKAITEAMPRQAIDSIESEIRQLAQRIDDNRHDGDEQALAGIESALGEIRESLKALTPAEQLAGFDEAIRGLNTRLDSIVRTTDDPASLSQLEGTIAALRTIVANVASNEALAQLRDDVHALSEKVDQLSQGGGYGETFLALEQRIATLTTALESRTPAAEPQYSEQLEGAMRTLSERLDRIPVGNDSPSALAHLEQRVVHLLERLETAADHRSTGLGRVEEGLQDVLRHLERQQSLFAAAPAAVAGDAFTDGIRRELSDIRHNQAEADKHTQDSLEAVHNTLGHVVDRLAMIESDLRAARAAPAPRPAPPLRPDLPNPALARSAVPGAPQTPAEPPPTAPTAPDAAAPRTEAKAPDAAPPKLDFSTHALIEPAPPARADLPPDHPLEPGTRPPGRMTPSERIAASEDALRDIAGASPPEPTSASSFIAAARRAAQAASNLPAAQKSSRASTLNESIRAAAKGSPLGSRIRALLVGASVVVLVLGSFKLAMTYLDGDLFSASKPMIQQSAAPDFLTSPDDDGEDAEAPAQPSMTSPTPIDRQSLDGTVPETAPGSDKAAADRRAEPPADVTGSILAEPGSETRAPPPAAGGTVHIPPSERLPDAIGGPTLRTSALKGDPAAANEVALRFAEGKGVTADLDQAAKWYARAAQGGIVPAMFRLGTFYEKGISVKKDVATARRYYLMAAERGSAKAMHNLAVLDADGGGHGANYRSAAQWFRNAAERGVADSQFNLGILYARGIGVQQDLAESFKWFSLAAAQGDVDAGRKRDDVAKRLDAQALAAAKLTVQNFTPVKQPDDAVNVPAPAGGWDTPAAKTTTGKTTTGKTTDGRTAPARNPQTARAAH